MREVYVAGIGMTSFSRLEFPLADIAAYPAMMALKDAGLTKIDHLYVANMGGSRLNHQTGLATAVINNLSLTPAGAETIENGPASSASAIKQGFLAVTSGMHDVVLVTGAERMRGVDQLEATDYVATLTHPLAEYIHGVTLPALAGMFAQLYMHKYGVTARHLAMVAVKNHENALHNPYAHLHQRITVEDVLNSPLIADPLRVLDCCPISDGGAAMILTTKEVMKKLGKPLIRLAGIGQATDTHAVHERPDITELVSVRQAAAQSFKMAGIQPSDVHVAELHDAFTILEIAESEEVGFFKKGEGHKALERGETQIGGRIPINTSGGLKARGHPVGATGLGQAYEIVTQLRGEAGKRQVQSAKIGFTCNFGGFGNNVVCLTFVRET